MEFVYEYRTSDNVRHEGSVRASTREDAFAALKAKGIRPGSLKEAPGLWNKLAGKGKRWMAIAALFLAVVAALIVIRRDSRALQEIAEAQTAPMMRHQIYGDPARMTALESADYASVFEHPGDRLLAHFAQPARTDGIAESLMMNPQLWPAAAEALADLADAPSACPLPDDAREVVELKRIVQWMRGELRTYLANGNGTPKSYLRRLIERQRREASISALAQRELEHEADASKWDERNEALRALGIATIPRPEKGDLTK